MTQATCSVEACDKPKLARGWCSLHWQRWRTHGDPLHERAPGVARRINTRGYVLLREPEHPYAFSNGYVLEHRKVWYDARGPVPPGAHIHHLNGIKDDNRLENLAVLDASEHHHLHATANVSPTCIKCGASDWYYPPSVSNRRCRACTRRRYSERRTAGLPGGG